MNSSTAVGFFPFFDNLAETTRLVRIAESYKEMGGEALFFTHGGSYEFLAKEIGCRIIPVNPIYTAAEVDELMKWDRQEKFGDPFPEEWLIEHVENEEEAYLENGVGLLVTGMNVPSAISARKAKIPLVWIIPGTTMPLYFEKGYGTYPDMMENWFTRFFPDRLKNVFTNWYMLRSKYGIRIINRVAERYNLPRFKRILDLLNGDYTLISDLREFLDIEETKEFPKENYIGPLLAHLNIPLTKKVESHLKRSGRSIFFSMGSSGNKDLFLRILNTLNQKDYNVVAAYTSILGEDELPKCKDHILLEKLVPAEVVSSMVDLSVLHGGQGTIYTAAYSGKPVVGIPMQYEQQYNIDILVRNKCALRLSKKYFSERVLLDAIDRIFGNYDYYLNNAKRLASQLPKVDGARLGAERIKQIIENLNCT